MAVKLLRICENYGQPENESRDVELIQEAFSLVMFMTRHGNIVVSIGYMKVFQWQSSSFSFSFTFYLQAGLTYLFCSQASRHEVSCD